MSIPDVKTRPVRPGRTTAARLYQELDGTRAEVTRLQGIIDTMGEQLREATSQAANKPKSDYIKELEAENNALDTQNAALSLMVRDTRRLLPEGKQEGHLPRLVEEYLESLRTELRGTKQARDDFYERNGELQRDLEQAKQVAKDVAEVGSKGNAEVVTLYKRSAKRLQVAFYFTCVLYAATCYGVYWMGHAQGARTTQGVAK